jgi:protein tyrosine phosphatase
MLVESPLLWPLSASLSFKSLKSKSTCLYIQASQISIRRFQYAASQRPQHCTASTAFATPISLSESTGVVARDEVSAQSED